MSKRNILLQNDCYKLGHMNMYNPEVCEIYSYLEARKPNSDIVFFGLQYYIKQYLINPQINVIEFIDAWKNIFGENVPQNVLEKCCRLEELGYLPVEIKAVPEGEVVESKNVLLTIRNTVDGFEWLVGFLESLILKVWNTCSVATCSLTYRLLVEKYAKETCDNNFHIQYQVHDFGYRGVSSEETADLSGSSHLLCFLGSDTVPTYSFVNEFYGKNIKTSKILASVPASEHSVMCSYTPDGELGAYKRFINELYPTGIVSIVSDTYDYFRVLTDYLPQLKEDILKRDGKVVIRPDSGVPELIILGNTDAPEGSPERKGSLELLWDVFGGSVNSKGYRVLDSHIGLIYGDGMYMERFELILEGMKKQGFATSNLVFGIGGLLLQNHSRDEFGFALKATKAKLYDGSYISLFKDPATDPGKKSKTGFMQLLKSDDNRYYTVDDVSLNNEKEGELITVFKDGELLIDYSFQEIRDRVEKYISTQV
jgi:nicotinamide phosphoribosyltransferase